MFDIELDLSDVKECCAAGNAHLLAVARQAPVDAAVEGQNQAIANRRYRDRTGALTGKAYVSAPVVTSTGAEVRMIWPVPYASHVDGGTPAHEIRPKRRAYLAFPGPGGQAVFARAVKHPGTRPYSFAGEAAQIAERVLVRDVEVGFRGLETILSR